MRTRALTRMAGQRGRIFMYMQQWWDVGAVLLASVCLACGGRVVETGGDGAGASDGSGTGHGTDNTSLPPLNAFSGRLALLHQDGTIAIYPAHPEASTAPLTTLTADAGNSTCVGLSFDQAANLYVSCPVNAPGVPPHISIYPPSAAGSARPERRISGPHTLLEQDAPSIAVDPSGAIYVDEQDRQVLVFAPEANGDAAPLRVLQWPAEAQTFMPAALAFDRAGHLFAANSTSGSVLVYPPNVMNGDGPVRRIGRSKELTASTSLSVAPDGTTFVFEASPRIFVYRPDAGQDAPSRVLTGGSFLGSFKISLAAEDTGRLFVLSGGRLGIFSPSLPSDAAPEIWPAASGSSPPVAIAIAP